MPESDVPVTAWLDDGDVRLYHGDCREVMAAMPDASVAAVVTDPPYGIHFMGKTWDQFGGPLGRDHQTGSERSGSMHAGKYDLAPEAMRKFQAWSSSWATEAWRVLKPGGFLLAFAGTRTYHRMACGVENAGFEVRDMLAWLFGSGFPKSLNLDGAWEGWGTALKPGHEPIVMARKPFRGTVAANVLAHGTGALNIDGCRIEAEQRPKIAHDGRDTRTFAEGGIRGGYRREGGTDEGRWPANVLLDEDAAAELDEQSGQLVSGANPTRRGSDKFRSAYGDFTGQRECEAARGVDVGGASRFYYVAKPSAAERGATNTHPTVKPVDLMRHLVRLVTPPGGVVLDPFAGSGTTLWAARLEGFRSIGIEREPDYLPIIADRLAQQSLLSGGAA